jgi:hypothetical protein
MRFSGAKEGEMTRTAVSALRLLGGILIAWGSLGLLAAGAQALLSFAKRNASTDRAGNYNTSVEVNPRASIPKALMAIYAALNDGNPLNAAQYLTPQILQNTSAIDNICRPFNLRGLFIETIAERQSGLYQATVHVLYKEGGERVYAMQFRMAGAQPILQEAHDETDDWVQAQKDEAISVVRKFLYAAKAGNDDIAKEAVVQSFPYALCLGSTGSPPTVATLSTAGVLTHLHWMQDVVITGVSTDEYEGVKIHVTAQFPEQLGLLAYRGFDLERIGGGLGSLKIVRAFIPDGISPFSNWAHDCDDTEMDNRTLKRFGLKSPPKNDAEANAGAVSDDKPQPSDGAYYVGHGVSAPTVAFKVEPEYTTEARTAKFRGTVVATIVVGVDGMVTKIKEIRGKDTELHVPTSLEENIVVALQKWTFRPGELDGQAVPVWVTVELKFDLV